MTKIEWADKSWNPITGCTKVSPGCANCYAERMARRLAGRYGYPEAPHHFDVTLRPDRLEQPFRWKKPHMIFVCSMSDLFHEDVPTNFIQRVFDNMFYAPWHVFLVLTKRPQRMAQFMDVLYHRIPKRPEPIRNVWLGVSVENQSMADERIPLLLQIPATVRFVSLEPMLGLIDLCFPEPLTGNEHPYLGTDSVIDKLDWVIVGGESGPGARPMHPQWARDIRDQCQAADVPLFFKAWGAWFPRSQWQDNPDLILPDDDYCVKGCNLKILDDDIMHRVGKKRAGRLLDGQLWEEYPR